MDDMSAVEELVGSYAGDPIGGEMIWVESFSPTKLGELRPMLSIKNGFFAFNESLWVLPMSPSLAPYELTSWNVGDLWKSSYSDPSLMKLVCFAFNIFGDQFYLGDDGCGRMDAETGELEPMGLDLEKWASSVIAEPDYYLGTSLARAWRAKNGEIGAGKRLVPKVPFVLGGEFAVENLFAMDALAASRYRGEIATQLRDVPDGSTVKIKCPP